MTIAAITIVDNDPSHHVPRDGVRPALSPAPRGSAFDHRRLDAQSLDEPQVGPSASGAIYLVCALLVIEREDQQLKPRDFVGCALSDLTDLICSSSEFRRILHFDPGVQECAFFLNTGHVSELSL